MNDQESKYFKKLSNNWKSTRHSYERLVTLPQLVDITSNGEDEKANFINIIIAKL